MNLNWSEYWIPGTDGWKFTTVGGLIRLKKTAQEKHQPLYRGIYYYPEAHRSNFRASDLIFDFDCKDNVDKARKDCIKAVRKLESKFDINPCSLELGYSGNKGYYIRLQYQCFLLDLMPSIQDVLREFTRWFKQFTSTLDDTFYSNGRLFREPNTVHEGSGLWRINLTYAELQYLDTELIKAYSVHGPLSVNSDPPEHPYIKLHNFLLQIGKEIARKKLLNESRKLRYDNHSQNSDIHLDNLPPRYQHLTSGVAEGRRNDAICILSGVFEACGLSEQEAVNEILKFNQRCSPPEREDAVRYKVDKLYGK